MQEAAGNPAEDAVAQLLVHLLRRGDLDRLVHLDERADHVCLPSLLDLLPHIAIDERAAVRPPHERADRLPSGRQVPDLRDIEIAVDRQRHRARDRRRRHHEHVGEQRPLLLERRALGDAEAMLLICDREPQRGELHRFLDECMGADDDVHLMRRDARDHLLPLLRRQVPREEADADGHTFEQMLERIIVLAREDLRRRHQRALEAVLHGLDEREQREYRLAGADIPLDEPTHGNRSLHIAADLLPDLCLVVRQRERQAREDLLHQLARREMTHATLRLARPLLEEQQAALDEVKLLKGEPLPRRRERPCILRKMDGGKGIAPRHETVRPLDCWRQDFPKRQRRSEQRLHLPTEERLVERLRRSINGQDTQPALRLLPLREDLIRRELAHGKLPLPAVSVFHPSRDEEPSPGLQFLFQETLVEPTDLKEAGPITDECRQDIQVPRSRDLFPDAHDRARRRRLLARLQAANRREAALVLVGAREIRQKIVDGMDAEAREFLCLLRSDALQAIDRLRQLHAQHTPLTMPAPAARP